MQTMDHGIELTSKIEVEIEALFRRLAELDPNALLRIEYLAFRFRQSSEMIAREYH